MNKAYLYLFLLMALVFSAEATTYPGKIIRNGDTTEVLIINKKFDDAYYESDLFAIVNFKLDASDQLRTISPFDADEIQIFKKENWHNKEKKWFRYISVKNDINVKINKDVPIRIFIRILEEGKINLYSFKPDINSTGDRPTVYVLDYKDGRMKNLAEFRFVKNAPIYFGSCPRIVKWIQDKKMRIEHIESIVSLYNEHCGKEAED